MEGVEGLSGEDKVKESEDIKGMDIADFAEEFLGCHLLWFQKQMLREMYNAHCENNRFLYSRAFSHSDYRYIILLKDCLEKE